jgi:cell division protein FtsL
MAVYQGARRRAPLPLGLDALADRAGRGERIRDGRAADRAAERIAKRAKHAATATGPAAARRADRAAFRSRPSSIGLAIAAIAIVFSVAFLSLSQSVRVAATGYDIVRLQSEHERLEAVRQDLQSDVQRLRSEPAIRKQALDAGLGQLGAPLVIPAR